MRIPGNLSPRHWLRVAVAMLVIIPLLAGGFDPSPEPEAVGVAAKGEAVDVSAVASRPRLERLSPGTRFTDRQPPSGWSRVVLKSTPMLASGALDTLSKEAFETARRIRLVILADVAQTSAEGPYVLTRLGVGLAAPVVGEADGGDVVVTATNVGDASGEWSTKDRIILAAGSRELDQATLTATTPTFAILRTPTTSLTGTEHVTLDVLYAVLVDPASGGLRLFACRPSPSGSAPVIRELASPAIVDGPLHVKARTFAGIPVSWSFAMIDVPEGDERTVPADLARLIAPDSLETAEARAVEGAFRAFAERPAIAPTARAVAPEAQRD
ncbi:hypothetical protein [Planctomyces sp. SH-PL62]|uniref:hypothetical protein n=1 Tax=Planctomyces sp. SH-PL62 TaxID=1636152 RepID=UPI0012E81125|nr:hypothetical protein [Planctomyces sp. SH-PL62]